MSARPVRGLILLSGTRLALMPPVMALVLVGDNTPHAYVAAAVLFVAAAITDFFDGYLARRWSLTTKVGSFLDTTADKVIVSGALIALVSVHRVSPWVVVIIISRELAVLALRGVVAAEGGFLPPSVMGKLKVNVQFVGVTMAIVRTPWQWGGLHPDEWVMLAAAGITVLSALDYFRRFGTALTGARDQ
jgi:CDP-diacylglycerol--glycerol-3-phosphate 3-phosphatidyltransferase